MKLEEQLPEPRGLDNAVGHGAILGFDAGAGHRVLPLGGPGHQIVSKEHGVARGGTPGVGATDPVSIGVDNQVTAIRWLQEKTQIQRSADIVQDALQSGEVGLPGIVHVEAHLLNGVGDVGARECQPLEGTSEAPVIRGILNRRTVCCQLRTNLHRCGGRLALGHPSAVQNLQHVLALREKQTGPVTLNVHPQKVVEFPQILHGELRPKSSNGALEKTGGRRCENDVIDVEQQVDHIRSASEDEQ
jgi:hypothetical protein